MLVKKHSQTGAGENVLIAGYRSQKPGSYLRSSVPICEPISVIWRHLIPQN
jgi:hypothetical protein